MASFRTVCVFLGLATTSFLLCNGHEKCTSNTDACAQSAPTSNDVIELGSIVAELKAEVESRMLACDFLQYLQHTIDHANNQTTMDCRATELLYARFTAQNTFSTIFKDLCNMILTYHDVDEYELNDASLELLDTLTVMKLVINNHLTEDGSHWELFYNDFRELGLNTLKAEKHANDLLLYWFGELTKGHRQTLYQVMAIDAVYDGLHDPIVRYILILMVEETGKLMFAKFTELYYIYMAKCANYLNLQYVAQSHSDVETGDLILTPKYLQYKHVFTEHVIDKHDQDRIDLLYLVGRKVYSTVINITMHQNYKYLTQYYKQQELWDLQL